MASQRTVEHEQPKIKLKPWRRGKALASQLNQSKLPIKPMRADLIASEFSLPGQPVAVRPFGAGNINDTYLAIFRDGRNEQPAIIQKIRRKVFPEPAIIMHNLRELSEHLQKSLSANAAQADREWKFPEIIKTKKGADFIAEPEGDIWRALTFIPGAQTYESVQSLAHAFEVGLVLGHFHRTVEPLPITQFKVALPGFHQAPQYWANFEAVLQQPSAQAMLKILPSAQVAKEFIVARKGSLLALSNAVAQGKLKLSISHGDPKAGNVMIDNETGHGVGLIDLDTVQPGLREHDFGDAARSLCNPAGEDPANLGDVGLDLELLKAFIDGYKIEVSQMQNRGSENFYYEAILEMTLELGLRFLTDHLAGDRYFKVRKPGQNLYRAQAQFRLAETIEKQEKEIREIVRTI